MGSAKRAILERRRREIGVRGDTLPRTIRLRQQADHQQVLRNRQRRWNQPGEEVDGVDRHAFVEGALGEEPFPSEIEPEVGEGGGLCEEQPLFFRGWRLFGRRAPPSDSKQMPS